MSLGSYRVVIRCHNLRRDVAAAMVLAELIKRKGGDTFITRSGNHIGVLKHWKPHVVVENVGGKVEHSYKASPGSRFFYLHSEGAGPWGYGSDDDAVLKYFHKVCCWGSKTVDYWRERLPQDHQHKIMLAGSPRLDLIKFDALPRQDEPSKSIGGVGRFPTLNASYGQSAIQWVQNEHEVDRVCFETKVYFGLYRVMRQLIEKTDYHISYRPHPEEAPERYAFLKERFGGRVTIDDSLDVAHWMKQQRVLITTASATFLEAYVLNIPCINIDKLSDSAVGAYYQGMAYKTGALPGSTDELFQMLASPPPVQPNSEIDMMLKENHNWYAPASALQTIADAVAVSARENKAAGTGLPKWVVCIWSRRDFDKRCKLNPLFLNYNYESTWHQKPAHLECIVGTILKKTTVA